jgi:NAD(P)-dependent dehydrogenase (short-subunit alcohol dehydrogenase family)
VRQRSIHQQPCKGAGCRPGAQHYNSRAYTSYGSYGTSKLANILFVKELARRCGRCWATPPTTCGRA